MKRFLPIAIVLIALLLVVMVMPGCWSEKPDAKVTFWVVAGSNRRNSFSRSSLGGYNDQGKNIINKKLPKYYIGSLALDNQGRIWLGQGWNDSRSSNLLLVWDEGELIHKVSVGDEPQGGITPFAGEMVAGCAETGMEFSLWAIDPTDFASRQVATVGKGERDFLILTDIAANGDYLLASAVHDDPQTIDSPRTSIWWYDKDFNLAGTLDLGSNTAVWSIVPQADGNFLLLNNSGFIDDSHDLLIFDPQMGTIVKKLKGSGFPFRGISSAGKIYILDRIWSSTRVNEQRSVTIIAGDGITTLPLPDDIGAQDIAVSDGFIYLAVWGQGGNFEDGIYRFDPQTDLLEQIISHPDASLILIQQ